MKFALGMVVATPGAMALLEEQGVHPGTLLQRHENGDWGDLGHEDKCLNDQAISTENRILSMYHVPDAKHRVYVITEADRSSTCILLPEEY